MTRWIWLAALASSSWGCGGNDFPAPLVTDCDGGSCGGGGSGGFNDGGRKCNPQFMTPGDAVVSGKVFVLDDATFDVRFETPVGFTNLKPFTGTARVEIESGGCELAFSTTDSEGNFTVTGVRRNSEGNYLRVIPEDTSEPMMLTAVGIPGLDLVDLEIPIVTRRSIEELLQLYGQGAALDESAGHVIAKVGVIFSSSGLPGAKAVATGFPAIYDGDGVTGIDGLGMFLNLPAPDYPGKTLRVEVTSPEKNGATEEKSESALLAKGAVSIALFGFSGL